MEEADLKHQLLALARRARAEQIAFIGGLTEEQRHVIGTPDHWSAKDLVAHVAAWWGIQGHRFALVAADQWPPSFGWSDEVNADLYATNCDRSWDEVEAEAASNHAVWLTAVEAISTDDLMIPGRIPAAGKRPLWRRVLGNGYQHPRIHLSEHLLERGEIEHATEIQESMADALTALSADLRGEAYYNLACFYAKAGQPDKAIARLAMALSANPEMRAEAQSDRDLDSLRDLKTFQDLVSQP
jgi:tetratricopeptide (TPR) repeat protein